MSRDMIIFERLLGKLRPVRADYCCNVPDFCEPMCRKHCHNAKADMTPYDRAWGTMTPGAKHSIWETDTTAYYP
jgi:hypothetical protein